MESAHRSVVFSVAALALASVGLLSGCDKGSPAGGGPGASASSAAPSAPAAAGGCDMEAFEKEQDEKGRSNMKDMPKKFTGCKFEGYDPKTKVMSFSGDGGKGMKLTCANDPKPEGVEPGNLVNVEGKVDGASFVRLYGCVVTKK